jgi:hypothetical protein
VAHRRVVGPVVGLVVGLVALQLMLTATSAVLARAPAAVAADLGITLVHLHPASVDLDVVCNPDPPVNVLVYLGDHVDFLGITPVVCAGGGAVQRVTVPLNRTLTAGSRVDFSATVSGDSGEINAFFPGALVEADPTEPPPVVGVPSAPRIVRVRACPHRVTLFWRAPARSGGAAVDRYRVRRPGHVRLVAPSRRSATFDGLAARHRYPLHVAAHNSAGWSREAGVVVRTSRPGGGCHDREVTASQQ